MALAIIQQKPVLAHKRSTNAWVKVDEEQQCRHSWSRESLKETVLSSAFAVTARIRGRWTREDVFVVKHMGAH